MGYEGDKLALGLVRSVQLFVETGILNRNGGAVCQPFGKSGVVFTECVSPPTFERNQTGDRPFTAHRHCQLSRCHGAVDCFLFADLAGVDRFAAPEHFLQDRMGQGNSLTDGRFFPASVGEQAQEPLAGVCSGRAVGGGGLAFDPGTGFARVELRLNQPNRATVGVC